MHEMVLRLKRGYWRTLLHAREIAEFCDERLTPARFDILYLLVQKKGGCFQKRIHRELGLSRSTICKMLARMEKLGLLLRERQLDDRRQNWVTLTSDGVDVISTAIRGFMHEPPVRHTFECIHQDPRGNGLPFLRRTRCAVERFARYFHDTSTLVYPMNPPDARRILADNKLLEITATVVADGEAIRDLERQMRERQRRDWPVAAALARECTLANIASTSAAEEHARTA